MKKLFFVLAHLCFLHAYSQLAVNSTKAPPDPSAMLDVSSTDRGALIPRMNSAQRFAIVKPAHGLIVFDTETNSFWYAYSGNRWGELSHLNANLWKRHSGTGSIFNTNTGPVSVGGGKPNLSAVLHVQVPNTQKGFLITGSHDPTGGTSTVPDLGAGHRMMYYPDKNVFRVGYADGDEWDNKNVGHSSIAMGSVVTAKGAQSIVIGNDCLVNDFRGIVIGGGSKALGEHSISIGRSITSNGGGLGIGNAVTAVGSGVAIGTGCTAMGGIAMGLSTFAENGSVAMGQGTKARGAGSTAMGINTIAKAYGSTAIGIFNDSVLVNNETAPGLASPLFMVGNGTSFNKRSNAFMVRMNGNAELEGTLKQLSDARLKRDIRPIHRALQHLLLIQGYNYYWNESKMDSSMQTGVIAQQIREVLPELVSQNESGVLAVNYFGLIPYMIEAAKEQQKQIVELKSENADMRKRLEMIEKNLSRRSP